MFKKVFIVIVGLLVAVGVLAAMQPANYHVERSIQIQAPAKLAWNQVSDFSKWKTWSPWAQADPNQKVTIDGNPGTVGHSSSWVGEKTGKGKMTIAKTTPPAGLNMDLQFYEPFASQAKSAFDFETQGENVQVTWSMDGQNDFAGKVFGLFMSMDDIVGTMYEKGLTNLKQVVESEAAKQAADKAPAEPTDPNTGDQNPKETQ